jgi:Peptidase M50B-like
LISDLLGEVWRRALSEQPAPPPTMIALAAAVATALVLAQTTWPYTRMIVTIVHEGGHALAALLTGRRLRGIRLHSDTSGLTVSSGRASGPGMVITLLAGYLAPALLGLVAVILLLTEHSLGLLWLLAIVLALMLLQIRNFFGFGVVVLATAGLLAVSWYAPAPVQSGCAYLITWILLVSAPRPVLELIGRRRNGQARRSDADQLARLTRTPAGLWVGFFLLLNCAGLAVGVALLLPALADLMRNLLASG